MRKKGAAYEIRIHQRVRKEIRSVGNVRDRKRILARIAALAMEPLPPTCERLGGYDAYRIRQGDYRIVYTIHDAILVIHVILVGNRKDIFTKLKRL